MRGEICSAAPQSYSKTTAFCSSFGEYISRYFLLPHPDFKNELTRNPSVARIIIKTINNIQQPFSRNFKFTEKKNFKKFLEVYIEKKIQSLQFKTIRKSFPLENKQKWHQW